MKTRYALTALLLSILLIFSGCFVGLGTGGYVQGHRTPTYSYEKPAPPPWAPAHGNRAKYHYRYYPSSGVYYDTGRGLYFSYRDGRWAASVSIPSGININVGSFVSLEMDTDKPYIHNDDIRKKYPPRHQKKADRGKKEKKNKHKNKGRDDDRWD